jgi:hypothetical protein
MQFKRIADMRHLKIRQCHLYGNVSAIRTTLLKKPIQVMIVLMEKYTDTYQLICGCKFNNTYHQFTILVFEEKVSHAHVQFTTIFSLASIVKNHIITELN